MTRTGLAAAFKLTIPVLTGYLFMGAAFGIMLEAAGYGVAWAFLMSLSIFAGSGQYLGVELLYGGAALSRVALLTFLLNFRHVVYGISMLEKFRGMGAKKLYMIFSLTDETYALLSSAVPPDGVRPKSFYFCVAVLNQLYWISGSVIGSLAGSVIKLDMTGIEFAMTAMFIVIAVEQWQRVKSKLPALIGAGVTLLSLILFGGENMLLPALFVMVALLLALRGKLEGNFSDEKEAGE